MDNNKTREHSANGNKVDQQVDDTPLFTARDTCVGLAACLGVGLLTSLTLSVIILFLSSNAQADDRIPTYSIGSAANINPVSSNPLNTIDNRRAKVAISKKCDTRIGQLKDIHIGDKLVLQPKGSLQQFFRVTGIQVIDKHPNVMPIVDESSMLAMVTCYPSDNAKLDLAVTYLVMIQKIAAYQDQIDQSLAHVSHQTFTSNEF